MARILALFVCLFMAANAAMAQPDFNAIPTTSDQDTTDLGQTRGQAAELDTELATVYFKQEAVGLTDDAIRELDRVVRLMQAHPELVVNVFGHADDTGSLYRMQELSDLRAQMVKAYLISRGISLDRIYSMGFGFRRPKSSEINSEGRAANRRVEIHIDYYNHQ